MAYVAANTEGLVVVDINNSYLPQIISSINRVGEFNYTRGVVVSDNVAYVSIPNLGLQILDISTPSIPKIISSIQSCSCQDIAIENNMIYAADGYRGLTIFNINNLLNPYCLSSKLSSGASGIEIVGDKAYIANGDKGLQIIDINNPSFPFIIGAVDTPGYANSIKVLDNKAYIADGESGLQIIDISNPLFPFIISSFDTSGYAADIAVNGSRVYVSVRNFGIQIIDITNNLKPVLVNSLLSGGSKIEVIGDKLYVAGRGLEIYSIYSSPTLIDSIYNFDDNIYGFSIINDTAYVADGYNGLKVIDLTSTSNQKIISSFNVQGIVTDVIVVGNSAYLNVKNTFRSSNDIYIVPVPMLIRAVIVDSSIIKMTLSIDKYYIPGNYTIRVFNNNGEASELPGAVTFVPPEDSYLLDTKAIIIAGDKSGNNIRTETLTSADFAYQTLLFQGYTAESVNYLSFDTSQPGVDDKASLAAVSDAVNNWSIKDPKATELLIYLVGHGEDGYFVINDNEHLTVEQLDQWLDNLQNTYDIPVTVIYDACYSGSFLPKLMPPAGKTRIVISSASAAEKAYFPVSAVSFSYQFWNAVYQGNEIGKAFRIAAHQMENYQTALLDADEDGIGTEAEIALAENMKVRRNYKPLTDVPYIYKVSDPQVLHDQTSAKITAGVSYIQDGTKVQRVWATVVPPDFKPDGPVTALPEIELTDPDGDGIYENTYTQFTLNGTYNIKVCAMNQKGMYALFKDTTIVRETGYIAAVSQDQVISQNSAKIWAALKPDIPVTRVWARIIPPISSGTPVETELSDPEHDGIYETVFNGFTTDGTYIAELYATDTQGYTSPAVLSKITYGSGAGRDGYEQDSTPELAGIPDFNTVQHHNFHTSEDTDWIKAFLSKDISYNIRIPNRNLCLPAIDLLKQAVPGDVNSDKKTDLKDVIAVLRIVAGLKTSANIFSDVNRDGKIGIEESLYGLQIAAGLIAESGSKLMTVKSSDVSFDWTPPETGVYYFKISNTVPGVFGQNVAYDFGIYKATAGIGGTIRGTVKSPSGEPVSEAMIFTDDGETDLSRDNGAFSITDSVGKRIITVQADGYEEYRTAVTLTEAEEQVLNIVMIRSEP